MALPMARQRPDPAAVAGKAFLRAGSLLNVPQAVLARVIGISESTMSRIAAGQPIDPKKKEGELALLFVRMFRSLDALLGGNTQQCQAWFHEFNHHLNGKPIELVQSTQGLVHVTDYLDAMRGKI